MKCDQCKAKLDHRAIRAQQGSTMVCPVCNRETTVRYSFRDSMTDPSVMPFGNLKYASRRLGRVWVVAFFLFFIILMIALIGVLNGQATITK